MPPISLLASSAAQPPAPPENVGSWRGGMTIAGVDLVAMVVSDSGLASTEPQWWNASPAGCFLIGLQPRGGWQVAQRAVQWGADYPARFFGVSCPESILYAHFATTIRNRIEVWDSSKFDSPMEGSTIAEGWRSPDSAPGFAVSRPSKLIDGSRGGQGFICKLLTPEGQNHYSIIVQARMQMLSMMLVAAALIKGPLDANRLRDIMREEFQVGDGLGVIFQRLLLGLVVIQTLAVALAITAFWDIFRCQIFGEASPFIIQIASLICWAAGAIGLLMLGGNPRVKIKEAREPPGHISERLEGYIPEQVPGVLPRKIRLQFGSIHGSTYSGDKGSCLLTGNIARTICKWDLELTRPWSWYIGAAWFGSLLVVSIALQIAGAQIATVLSEVMSIGLLLLTALFRGYGLSGPEEWQIPSWKHRGGVEYGASLAGFLSSRLGGR